MKGKESCRCSSVVARCSSAAIEILSCSLFFRAATYCSYVFLSQWYVLPTSGQAECKLPPGGSTACHIPPRRLGGLGDMPGCGWKMMLWLLGGIVYIIQRDVQHVRIDHIVVKFCPLDVSSTLLLKFLQVLSYGWKAPGWNLPLSFSWSSSLVMVHRIQQCLPTTVRCLKMMFFFLKLLLPDAPERPYMGQRNS